VDRYFLQGRTNGGALTNLTLPSPLAPSDRRYLAPGHTYLFQISSVDAANNVSNPAVGPTVALELHQETAATYSAGWEPRSHAFASGGGTRATSVTNATASYTFTGTDIAWISTRADNRGQATVSIDGGPATLVDLYNATLQGRRIVFAATGLTDGPHTLTVTVLGLKNAASSGFRVDIDAFAVLNPV
jgi:hypothetical protein